MSEHAWEMYSASSQKDIGDAGCSELILDRDVQLLDQIQIAKAIMFTVHCRHLDFALLRGVIHFSQQSADRTRPAGEPHGKSPSGLTEDRGCYATTGEASPPDRLNIHQPGLHISASIPSLCTRRSPFTSFPSLHSGQTGQAPRPFHQLVWRLVFPFIDLI